MIQEFFALLVAHDQEELASILQAQAMLYFMILIGILQWISRHKIAAIVLVKPETL